MAQVVINTDVKLGEGTLTQDALNGLDTSNHTHAASAITSGTFAGARIPPVNSMVIHDRRTTNQTPNWYYANYPKQKVVEFKQLSAIGITADLGAFGTYCTLETFCPWNDSSGGGVSQVAYNLENRSIWTRRGSTTSWGAWLVVA